MKPFFLAITIFAYFFSSGIAFGQTEIGPVRTDDGDIQTIDFFPEKVDGKLVSSRTQANKWLKENLNLIIIDIKPYLSAREGAKPGLEAFQNCILIIYREPSGPEQKSLATTPPEKPK